MSSVPYIKVVCFPLDHYLAHIHATIGSALRLMCAPKIKKCHINLCMLFKSFS